MVLDCAAIAQNLLEAEPGEEVDGEALGLGVLREGQRGSNRLHWLTGGPIPCNRRTARACYGFLARLHGCAPIAGGEEVSHREPERSHDGISRASSGAPDERPPILTFADMEGRIHVTTSLPVASDRALPVTAPIGAGTASPEPLPGLTSRP